MGDTHPKRKIAARNVRVFIGYAHCVQRGKSVCIHTLQVTLTVSVFLWRTHFSRRSSH
jgi:hypothetical protein